MRILIGGSPCTNWSVAKSKNRETTAEGIGWELFKNYLIAKAKFQPDLFLYENNKSAAHAIKDQIAEELGVPLQYINSADFSAQTRQRFYAHNFGDVDMPEPSKQVVADILETGVKFKGNKGYELDPRHYGDREIPGFIGKQEIMRVGTIKSSGESVSISQSARVYSPNGKSSTMCACGGGGGAKTGLYMCPVTAEEGITPTYEVLDGKLLLEGRQIKLPVADGLYAIRMLTVKEVSRLQTLPDEYCLKASQSSSAAYQGLGNGWTADVIIHLLEHALRGVDRDEPIEVLSMYDGIGTGRYCLEQLGFTNVTYVAYEIDKSAMAIALSNYPDIKQCGDAFALRDDSWFYPSIK